MEIVKGTTPTIEVKFSIVDPTTITAAILTISANSIIVLQKELTDATVGTNSLSWTLTQSETLQLAGRAIVMLNWLTSEGVRGVSESKMVWFSQNPVNEVME